MFFKTNLNDKRTPVWCRCYKSYNCRILFFLGYCLLNYDITYMICGCVNFNCILIKAIIMSLCTGCIILKKKIHEKHVSLYVDVTHLIYVNVSLNPVRNTVVCTSMYCFTRVYTFYSKWCVFGSFTVFHVLPHILHHNNCMLFSCICD